MPRPSVRVALPWLQTALADAMGNHTQPPLAALRWLGGRGRLQGATATPWREWLLEPTDMSRCLRDWPAGPAVARERGADLGAGHTWCLAQPVHLAAGLDHLRLAPLAAATLTAGEADELAASIRAHFGDDEIAVAPCADDVWLLRFARVIDSTTQPPELAVGHNVHDFMPAGPDGARVRSLMNEIQMLLHEHPVNERRARAGKLPVNAWWLWGFGKDSSQPVPPDHRWSLRGDDAWLRALWGRDGLDRDPASPLLEPLQGDTLIALTIPPAVSSEESLAAIDTGLLAWLATQVRTGAIQRLDMLAGSIELHIDVASRFRFWRRPVDIARWLE